MRASPATAAGVIEVRAVAGPVCPVETVPPDPACEPRPVAGAPIFVMPADGRDVVVAQGTTDEDGLVRLDGGLLAAAVGLAPDDRRPVGEIFADALRLSRGMTYKNALAGLPLGGGNVMVQAK